MSVQRRSKPPLARVFDSYLYIHKYIYIHIYIHHFVHILFQHADQLRASQGDEYVALDHLAVACVEEEAVIQAAIGEAGVSPKKMAAAAKVLLQSCCSVVAV